MPCSTLLDPACIVSGVGGSIASSASSGFLSALANGVRSALDWMFTNTVTLWLKIPSLYPSGEAPALHRVQGWLLPATAAVAVGGAIAAGARMALTRKHAPLLDLTGGLAVIALAAALGIALPTALMQASDAWTHWVLRQSTGGDLTARLNVLLGSGYGSGIPDVAVIVFGSIATVASGIQALLLLFREAAILILAAVLPLAAAGAIAPATRGWIKKITGWMLALIFYPAAAACVYATGFTMIGTGTGLRALLIGFAMIVLSVVALPVLMKFFTWTTGTISSGGGGAGQFLGLAAAGALGLGALRGGGSPGAASAAAQQAQYMNANTPPPAGPSAASSAGPSSGPSGGPGASGPSGTPGTAGSPGPSGTPGPSGASGPSGSTGPSGAPGPAASGGRDAGPSAPGANTPGAGAPGSPAQGSGSRRPGGSDPAAPGEAVKDQGSPGAGQAAAGGPAARPGTRSGPGGASGAAPPGPPPSSSGPAAAGGKVAAARSGPAAAGFAALFAAQAMATGAKNAAASAMEPEERS